MEQINQTIRSYQILDKKSAETEINEAIKKVEKLEQNIAEEYDKGDDEEPDYENIGNFYEEISKINDKLSEILSNNCFIISDLDGNLKTSILPPEKGQWVFTPQKSSSTLSSPLPSSSSLSSSSSLLSSPEFSPGLYETSQSQQTTQTSSPRDEIHLRLPERITTQKEPIKIKSFNSRRTTNRRTPNRRTPNRRTTNRRTPKNYNKY